MPATAIPGGVNFTVYSHGAASIELLLFHREESEPYAVLGSSSPKITYSMAPAAKLRDIASSRGFIVPAP